MATKFDKVLQLVRTLRDHVAANQPQNPTITPANEE